MLLNVHPRLTSKSWFIVNLCSLKKNPFVSVVWLSLTAGAQFVTLGSNKGLGAPVHPCSGFLMVSVQETLEIQQCISSLAVSGRQITVGQQKERCNPVTVNSKPFQSMSNSTWDSTWLWCSGHSSAKGSQGPVLSYGCMRLKPQQRGTAVELGREISLPIITANGCIEHRWGCNCTGSWSLLKCRLLLLVFFFQKLRPLTDSSLAGRQWDRLMGSMTCLVINCSHCVKIVSYLASLFKEQIQWRETGDCVNLLPMTKFFS